MAAGVYGGVLEIFPRVRSCHEPALIRSKIALLKLWGLFWCKRNPYYGHMLAHCVILRQRHWYTASRDVEALQWLDYKMVACTFKAIR